MYPTNTIQPPVAPLTGQSAHGGNPLENTDLFDLSGDEKTPFIKIGHSTTKDIVEHPHLLSTAYSSMLKTILATTGHPLLFFVTGAKKYAHTVVFDHPDAKIGMEAFKPVMEKRVVLSQENKTILPYKGVWDPQAGLKTFRRQEILFSILPFEKGRQLLTINHFLSCCNRRIKIGQSILAYLRKMQDQKIPMDSVCFSLELVQELSKTTGLPYMDFGKLQFLSGKPGQVSLDFHGAQEMFKRLQNQSYQASQPASPHLPTQDALPAPAQAQPQGFQPAQPPAQAQPQGFQPAAPAQAQPQGFQPAQPAQAQPQGFQPAAPAQAQPQGFQPAAPAQAQPQGFQPAQPPAQAQPQGFQPAQPAQAQPQGFQPAQPAQAQPQGFQPAQPAQAQPQGFQPAQPAQAQPAQPQEGYTQEVLSDGTVSTERDGDVIPGGQPTPPQPQNITEDDVNNLFS